MIGFKAGRNLRQPAERAEEVLGDGRRPRRGKRHKDNAAATNTRGRFVLNKITLVQKLLVRNKRIEGGGIPTAVNQNHSSSNHKTTRTARRSKRSRQSNRTSHKRESKRDLKRSESPVEDKPNYGMIVSSSSMDGDTITTNMSPRSEFTLDSASFVEEGLVKVPVLDGTSVQHKGLEQPTPIVSQTKVFLLGVALGSVAVLMAAGIFLFSPSSPLVALCFFLVPVLTLWVLYQEFLLQKEKRIRQKQHTLLSKQQNEAQSTAFHLQQQRDMLRPQVTLAQRQEESMLNEYIIPGSHRTAQDVYDILQQRQANLDAIQTKLEQQVILVITKTVLISNRSDSSSLVLNRLGLEVLMMRLSKIPGVVVNADQLRALVKREEGNALFALYRQVPAPSVIFQYAPLQALPPGNKKKR